MLLEPFRFLCYWRIFLDEFVDGCFDVEFVGVGIGLGILFEVIDHFGSVLEVGGGVKDFFGLYFFLLPFFLFGFFGCLFSFFSLQSFLLLLPILLLFAFFRFPFGPGFVLLDFLLFLLGCGFLLLRLAFFHQMICDKRNMNKFELELII